jgi:hypothetical protein
VGPGAAAAVGVASGCEQAGSGGGSINAASSSLARELFTLFETGHRCSTSFAAGLSNTPMCGVLNGHVGAEVKRGDAQGRGPHQSPKMTVMAWLRSTGWRGCARRVDGPNAWPLRP